MAYFYLPGIVNLHRLNMDLLKLAKETPRILYPDVTIGGIYGCFGGCIWNCGRYIGGQGSFDVIKQTVAAYEREQLPLRLTFTNPMLTEEHLYDTYANMLLKQCDNGLNEIIVASPILEQYIRDKYPGYRLISSTTKSLLDVDEVNRELGKDYKLVVLDYRLNNEETIKQIAQPDKLEILLNESCSYDCSRRKEHYAFIAKSQLEYAQGAYYECDCQSRGFFETLHSCDVRTFVKRNDKDYKGLTIEKCMDLGVKHFKVQGRSAHILDVVESYLYYLIKPEYKDSVRYLLLKPHL